MDLDDGYDVVLTYECGRRVRLFYELTASVPKIGDYGCVCDPERERCRVFSVSIGTLPDPFLWHYSEALDEIYRLRAILAYESQRIHADLGLRSFPKSRRDSAEKWMRYLQEAARGGSGFVYAQISYPKMSLKWVGAREELTRTMWEESRGRP